MSDRIDPFDLLAMMAPETADRVLVAGDDPVADRLLQRILAGDPTAGPVRRDRRSSIVRRIVGGGLALVAVGGGAVAFSVWSRAPKDSVTILCYSDPVQEPALKVGVRLDGTQSPIEACTREWLAGEFAEFGQPDSLTACVTSSDVIAVIPADPAACAGLGMAIAEIDQRAISIDGAVARRVPELLVGCVTNSAAAVSDVRQLFDELGATEWTVVVDAELDADRPCYANLVDASTKTVRLIPFQPPPTD